MKKYFLILLLITSTAFGWFENKFTASVESGSLDQIYQVGAGARLWFFGASMHYIGPDIATKSKEGWAFYNSIYFNLDSSFAFKFDAGYYFRQKYSPIFQGYINDSGFTWGVSTCYYLNQWINIGMGFHTLTGPCLQYIIQF